MSQFLHSVRRWFRQNGIALVRIMFSLLCIGLAVYKAFKLDEVDFASVIILLLAAFSFRPTMFEAIPRFVRRVKVAGVDLDLHDRDSTHIQEQFDAAQDKSVLPSERMPPTSAASTVGEISEIVRTKRIVLHDGNTNEERARLFVAGSGAVSLQLCDSAGEPRATMWVSEDGKGRVNLVDNRGIMRLLLNGSDSPVIVRDSKDVARGGFFVADDEVFFALMGDNGVINCSLKANAEGGVIRADSTDEKSTAGLVAVNALSGALYLGNSSTGEKTTSLAGRAAKIDKGDRSE